MYSIQAQNKHVFTYALKKSLQYRIYSCKIVFPGRVFFFSVAGHGSPFRLVLMAVNAYVATENDIIIILL